MTIARVERFLVAPRWLLVRIETHDGIVGWGEATCEGRSDTVARAVDELSELLVGQQEDRIEDLWQIMSKGSFYRGGAILSSAVSGIDMALWDIKGKRANMPIHDLLGGAVRDRVRVYCWVGGDEPDEVADQIAGRVEQGFSAVKMNACGAMTPLATQREIDGVLHRVSVAKEVLGPDRDVAVDFHGRVSYPNAKRLVHELEPLRPMFVEEPLIPEDSHLFNRIVEATSIPIATGERLFERREFLPVLNAGVAVVQPDLAHAGGITEVRKIASLAESFGALLAPHCPLGPIALGACLQVALCTSNHVIQEGSFGIHYNKGADVLDYLVDTSIFQIQDGFIERLTGPGLGIEIDDAAVRDAAAHWVPWRGPIWRHRDGGFAEW